MASYYSNVAGEQRSTPNKRKLIVGIDGGTSTQSTSFLVTTPRGSPRTHEVHNVWYESNNDQAPMIAAWVDGRFEWGHRLQDMLDSALIEEESVIRFFKLLLYKEWCESYEAKRVQALLEREGRSVLDLFTAVLEAIYEDALRYIFTHAHGKDPKIAQYDRQVYLSVPKNITLQGQRLLADAAARANLPGVVLVSEPVCASAYNLQRLVEDPHITVRTGSKVVVVDGGGGTLDTACFRLASRGDDGARAKFSMLGSDEGSLNGSEIVGDRMLAWVCHDYDKVQLKGGISYWAHRLSMPTERLKAKIRQAFEPHKRKFGPNSPVKVVFSIVGGDAEEPEVFQVRIPWLTMKTFFDPSIESVITLVRRHLDNDYEKALLIATGGFGMSPYLQSRLEETFPGLEQMFPHGQDCYFPVSKGACLRFNVIDTTQLRSLDAFGVTQEEDYNPEVHIDGMEAEDREVPDGRGGIELVHRGEIDLRVVKKGFWDKKYDVVEDRIQWLITQNDEPDHTGWYVSRRLWQLGHVNVRDRKVSAKIVRTTSREIRNGDPLTDKHTGDTHLHLQVMDTLWGRLDDNLAKQYSNCKIRKMENGKNGSYFVIWATVVLRHNNKRVEAGFEIAPPNEVPGNSREGVLYGSSAHLLPAMWSAPVWPEGKARGLWDHRFDPNVHDIVPEPTGDIRQSLPPAMTTEHESRRRPRPLQRPAIAGPSSSSPHRYGARKSAPSTSHPRTPRRQDHGISSSNAASRSSPFATHYPPVNGVSKRPTPKRQRKSTDSRAKKSRPREAADKYRNMRDKDPNVRGPAVSDNGFRCDEPGTRFEEDMGQEDEDLTELASAATQRFGSLLDAPRGQTVLGAW